MAVGSHQAHHDHADRLGFLGGFWRERDLGSYVTVLQNLRACIQFDWLAVSDSRAPGLVLFYYSAGTRSADDHLALV